MRALCGAIITAAALIGLGLTALALGVRYQDMPVRGADGQALFIHFKELDTALMIALVVLILSALVGMGLAFLGLAYHHERRHREHHLHTSALKSSSLES